MDNKLMESLPEFYQWFDEHYEVGHPNQEEKGVLEDFCDWFYENKDEEGS